MAVRHSLKAFKRRGPVRRPRLRILIVSEGAKTEGLYFSVFSRSLNAANIQVDIMGKECGSDPLTVVEFAAGRFCQDRGYDLCYCVIDRDEHDVQRYSAALAKGSKINAQFKTRSFYVIVSDPCIEFWFILHFVFSRSPFIRKGNRSPGECALDELKKYAPGYTKSSKEEMEKFILKTSDAIANSKKALADAQATGEFNPSTRIHELIERITLEASK